MTRKNICTSLARKIVGPCGLDLLHVLIAILLLLLVTPVTSWVTIDGGHTITMHGNTSIGPKLASGKYDLTVMGDMRVGDVEKVRTHTGRRGMWERGRDPRRHMKPFFRNAQVYPNSPIRNVDVEGAISAAQMIFRGNENLGSGTK